MPWEVAAVSDRRAALVHQVRDLRRPMAAVCREFGVCRKTGYKWLARAQAAPDAALEDRPRRPIRSPARTAPELERAILSTHDRFGWGARKLRAYLLTQGVPAPAARTVHRVLERAGRVRSPEPAPAPPRRFEHENPNDLWQIDFKGPIEVARRPVHPLTVLDDHSRMLLALHAQDAPSPALAWEVLWEVFATTGLPEAILCDNAFGTRHQSPRTLSRFEANLVLLGVRCTHGRPFHPQTQGKVERLHATLERELWPRIDRSRHEWFQADLDRWRRQYNAVRPSEAIGDVPPACRWRPSHRRRPDRLPEPTYPPGSTIRVVSSNGTVRWRSARILAGYGLIGEPVRLQETADSIEIYFSHRLIRSLQLDQLTPDRVL